MCFSLATAHDTWHVFTLGSVPYKVDLARTEEALYNIFKGVNLGLLVSFALNIAQTQYIGL